MIERPTNRYLLYVLYLAVMLGLLQAGCAAHPYDHNQLQSFLQKPNRPVTGVEYRVLPPDIIGVKSQHILEINNIQQQIRPDGRINLPLLGDIYVAQKTPSEIERHINALASKYYDEVDATVEVVGFNSRKFYVFGQVGRPGPYPWTGHDTLLDALCQATPSFLAWPEKIIVIRGSTPQEGGQYGKKNTFTYKSKGVHKGSKTSKSMTVNLWAMIKHGDMTNNIMLMPNDIIHVQPNPWAELGMKIQTLLLPIRPATETLRTPAAVATGTGF